MTSSGETGFSTQHVEVAKMGQDHVIEVRILCSMSYPLRMFNRKLAEFG